MTTPNYKVHFSDSKNHKPHKHERLFNKHLLKKVNFLSHTPFKHTISHNFITIIKYTQNLKINTIKNTNRIDKITN